MQREALIALTVMLTLAVLFDGDVASIESVATSGLSASPTDGGSTAALSNPGGTVVDRLETTETDGDAEICDWQIRFAGNGDTERGSFSVQLDVAM